MRTTRSVTILVGDVVHPVFVTIVTNVFVESPDLRASTDSVNGSVYDSGLFSSNSIISFVCKMIIILIECSVLSDNACGAIGDRFLVDCCRRPGAHSKWLRCGVYKWRRSGVYKWRRSGICEWTVSCCYRNNRSAVCYSCGERCLVVTVNIKINSCKHLSK